MQLLDKHTIMYARAQYYFTRFAQFPFLSNKVSDFRLYLFLTKKGLRIVREVDRFGAVLEAVIAAVVVVT